MELWKCHVRNVTCVFYDPNAVVAVVGMIMAVVAVDVM